MKKPRLSFWQIWNMSFGFLGIQFGFALQNANVSRIFETLGASMDAIPILWIAAPITGLIVQPIIGHMSDHTWNRLGRRRPYFLSGAILASLALLVMPNSPMLWVAAGMLWIMDASINISMEPFRAFVGDMLSSDQRTKGFAMQSFFIGTGAIVASALPYVLTNWFNIPNTAPEGFIPKSVKFSFYIGSAVFFLAVLWTVVRTREYSPEQIKSFAGEAQSEGTIRETPVRSPQENRKKFLRNSYIWILGGLIAGFFIYYYQLKTELYILAGGLAVFGIVQLLAGYLTGRGKFRNGFVEVINDLINMPRTMAQLAVVQFFSWFALFAMWIYTTGAVTTTKYDMQVDRPTWEKLHSSLALASRAPGAATWNNLKDTEDDLEHIGQVLDEGKKAVATIRVVKFFLDSTRTHITQLDSLTTQRLKQIDEQYNDGADWVGVLMAVYNGFAAIMAFVIIWLARFLKRKMVHAISLVIGGIGLISFFIIRQPEWLIVSELGIGLAWASILSMPYAILTGSLPVNKLGTYMGIFNFFIVIPQIMAATLLGFFVKTVAGEQPIYALVLGGVSMVVAALFVLIVKDVDDKKA
jgi:MFS family permease